MADWKKQLDDFLTLYEYDKYNEADTISAEQAKEKAYAEYDKFRLIQDKEFLSDFDKEVKVWKERGGMVRINSIYKHDFNHSNKLIVIE